MAVREATLEDMPRILELGREFFAESGYKGIIEYDEDSARTTFEGLIASETAVILLMEMGGLIVGGAGAMVAPFYMNANQLVGQEFFWFVSEDFRGTRQALDLFNCLEAWSRSVGAEFFVMIALRENFDKVSKLYERKGYIKTETNFIKRF